MALPLPLGVAERALVALCWPALRAIGAVVPLAGCIDALAGSFVEPVVFGALLADLRVRLALVAQPGLAGQVQALEVPLVEVVALCTAITAVDS